MFLVLIETKGNQPYVFATNRLRLAVGGSELIRRVGDWVLEAAGITPVPADALDRATAILGQVPITDGSKQYEVIVATSGLAAVLAATAEDARQLITKVTQKALKEAPMLDVAGVFVEVDLADDSLAAKYTEAVDRLREVRMQLPSPLARYPQHPLVQRCRHSGLPATDWAKDGELGPGREAVSADVRARLDVTKPTSTKPKSEDSAGARLKALAEHAYEAIAPDGTAYDISILADIGELERKLGTRPWMAIVHADGNGVGQVFINLGEDYRELPDSVDWANHNRAYIELLRAFSLGLEIITEDAFFDAFAELTRHRRQQDASDPLAVPLLLGGDDATFICDGLSSLDLTATFIAKFIAYSTDPKQARRLGDAGNATATTLAVKLTEGRNLTRKESFGMAAGIAATKVHHPFHSGYALAKSLLHSAKKCKVLGTSTGSLDFHVLYDSTSSDLEDVRDRRAMRHAPRQHGGPYVLGADRKDFVGLDTITGIDDELRADSERERSFNALLHRLRTAALDSPAAAQAILATYRNAGNSTSNALLNTIETLITPHLPGSSNGPLLLLDVLDLAALRIPNRPATTAQPAPVNTAAGMGAP